MEEMEEDIEENSLSESSEEPSFNEGKPTSPNLITINPLTPKVGMTFRTVDEAYEFYCYYACRIGFGVAKTCSRRKDGVQHEYTFSCEKSGKPKDKKGVTPKRTRISKKTGCQAKFRVRINDKGIWNLAFLVLHHNHYCLPDESHHYRSHKLSSFRSLPVVDLKVSEGNSSNGLGKFWLGDGDVEAFSDFFARMQKEDPLFFQRMDLDSEGRIRNVFWADTRSRMLYPFFNDVVLMDSSCLSYENCSIPFVAFTGVNHHGSTVFFGGALLSEERPETYAWLLKTWLDSMNGLAPKAIVTAKSKSMDSAVLEVLPNSLHRLCVWQIMMKVPETLAVKERLYEMVFDSQRVEDFEVKWELMVNEFKLGDDEWLTSLYEERRRWVPAFVKGTFWAGISGINRSAHWIPLFDSFVTSKKTLKQFFAAYEAAIQANYNRELDEDLENRGQIEFSFISRLSMEEEFYKIYTLKMFQKFQRELQKCVDCTCVLLRKEGDVSVYLVKERVKQKIYSNEVIFNEDQVEVQCLCGGFEFGGILCAHAVVVLKEKDVQKVPPRYICQRWKRNHMEECHRHYPLASDFLALQPSRRLSRFMLHCLPYLWKLAETEVLRISHPEKLLRLLVKVEKKLSNAGMTQKAKGSMRNRIATGASQVNGSPNVGGNDGDASQLLVPCYLARYNEQQKPSATEVSTSIVPLSISSSLSGTEFWVQKETLVPSNSQLRTL